MKFREIFLLQVNYEIFFNAFMLRYMLKVCHTTCNNCVELFGVSTIFRMQTQNLL